MYRFRTDLEAKSAPHVDVPQAHRMMCLNESCLDPYPRISASFMKMLERTGVNHYMSPITKELYHELATYCGVAEDMVLIGNGADDIIYHLMTAVRQDPNSFAVCLDPSYFDYKTYASAVNLKLKLCELKPDFSFDPDEFLDLARDPNCKLAILCNPNNPTGNLFKNQDLAYVISSLPDIPVLVDETYFEFSRQSFVNDLHNYPNLILVRSFSKAFSSAGLRFGFALSASENIMQMRKVQTTFHTGTLVQAFALAILQNKDIFAAQVSDVVRLRDDLYSWLSIQPEFTVHKSATNFLTFKAGERSADLFIYLREQGIALRDVGAHPLLRGFLRVTVSCADDVRAFKTVVEQWK